MRKDGLDHRLSADHLSITSRCTRIDAETSRRRDISKYDLIRRLEMGTGAFEISRTVLRHIAIQISATGGVVVVALRLVECRS